MIELSLATSTVVFNLALFFDVLDELADVIPAGVRFSEPALESDTFSFQVIVVDPLLN